MKKQMGLPDLLFITEANKERVEKVAREEVIQIED